MPAITWMASPKDTFYLLRMLWVTTDGLDQFNKKSSAWVAAALNHIFQTYNDPFIIKNDNRK